MPSKRLANSTDKVLDELIGLSQEDFLSAIVKLNRDIQRMLNRIKTAPDGTIRGPTITLKSAAKFQKELAVLYLQTYGKAAREHLNRYPAIAKTVEEVYTLLAKEKVGFTVVSGEGLRALRLQDTKLHRSLSTQSQALVSKAIYSHVLGLGNIDELRKQIAGALVGHVDVRGTPLATYAKTYAQDQVMQYHANSNKILGDQIGVEKWWYVGDTIETTRPFCEEHAGDVKTTAEWEEIGKGDWTGKSCSDIFVCRGGYNCRHHFQAIVN